jgi:outer membrane protein OmpA-like peptidoglycan-associated protein
MLLPTVALSVGQQRFGASMHEAEWVPYVSRLECRLSQHIPRYGTATFARHAGGELHFTIHVMRPPAKPDYARLSADPPAWNHDAALRDLGRVSFSAGKVPFTLDRTLSRRLLTELEQGMSPTLSYKDWSDGRDEVRVSLSAVNFRASLGEFLSCLDDILPFDFPTVALTTLHFDFGGTEISTAGQRQLTRVARYLRADDAVKKVTIDSYTDTVGYRKVNDKMSHKRAQAVRDFLTARGVDASRFELRAHGEREPKYSNRTAKGRALNRRVVVKLVK